MDTAQGRRRHRNHFLFWQVIEMIDAVHKEGVSTGSESSSSDPQMDFGTFVRLMEHDASYHANPHHHHRSHKPSERAQGSEYAPLPFD